MLLIRIMLPLHQERGKSDILSLFSAWNSFLRSRTWLVGERMSLADVALATRWCFKPDIFHTVSDILLDPTPSLQPLLGVRALHGLLPALLPPPPHQMVYHRLGPE